MIWVTTVLAFVMTAGIALLLYYAFLPRADRVAGRLEDLWRPSGAPEESYFTEKRQQQLERLLEGFAKLLPTSDQMQARNTRLLLRAGYHQPAAANVVRGAKVVLPILLVAALFFSGVYKVNPIFLFAIGAVSGFVVPDIWLTGRIRKRQHQILRGLPDMLDLLVVSVEAGMGLDRALFRVAQEILIVHQALSEELHLVNLEMRLGKSRLEALRDLTERTGVEDIRLLVAMLVQTERFGTDLAQSLRVQSQSLRTKQRQHAEEMAVKATVKMIPALVFFIFPALFVVLLGPAVISIMREFHAGLGH
jgi:tight adherence protein C